MSSFFVVQPSLSSTVDSIVENLPSLPDGREDQTTEVHFQELMQLTSTMSSQSQGPGVLNEILDMDPKTSGAFFAFGTKKPADESPRGLSDWAAVFDEEDSQSAATSMRISPLPSHTETVEGSPGLESCIENCILPQSCATIFADLNVSKDIGGWKSNATEEASLRLEWTNSVSKAQIARREKCKRARLGAFARGRQSSTCENSADFGEATTSPSFKTAEEVERSRSRERKIRNRASVQRCRAKKMYYYERLEAERKILRCENETITQALTKFVNDGDVLRMLCNEHGAPNDNDVCL